MNSSAEAQYEVREGTLFVNHIPVPLRKGIIYASLVRAGWRGVEGLLPAELVDRLLRVDQRLSLLAAR